MEAPDREALIVALQDHLVAASFADATVLSYVSTVSACLKQMSDPSDAQAFQRYLDSSASRWRSTARVAWGHLLRCVPEGTVCALPPTETAVPPRVAQAVCLLALRLPLRKLRVLRWCEVDLDNGLLQDPDQPGIGLPVSNAQAGEIRAALQLLLTWAKPTDGSHPVIPAVPGFPRPRSPQALRAILRSVNAPAPTEDGESAPSLPVGITLNTALSAGIAPQEQDRVNAARALQAQALDTSTPTKASTTAAVALVGPDPTTDAPPVRKTSQRSAQAVTHSALEAQLGRPPTKEEIALYGLGA